MGGLRPAHIPPHPFTTVSLDLIIGLPPSGKEKFMAILVIVNKLTRFSIMIPTYTNLTQEGFAAFFVERIVNVFSMLECIISDCDKRWAMAFWHSVTMQYGSVLALSSAHHPQTDGQTKILNAMIEQMLRAYVAADCLSWARWLGEITFTYNSNIHGSTGYSPNFLLFSYNSEGCGSAGTRETGSCL
jgi:hypothetical protein